MILALDAMGVIYASADDVVELLCPFIHEHGGLADDDRIIELYRQASLGRLTAAQFWREVNIDPVLEDAYLSRHKLVPGLLDFLTAIKPRVSALWCISNDIGQWSRKLRENFALTPHFAGWIISGDVAARKPDPAIFHRLLAESQAAPQDILFVDDRSANLDGAAALGLRTVLFSPTPPATASPHQVAANFHELQSIVSHGVKI
jgi:putative hydrolase of the HAD superfamily